MTTIAYRDGVLAADSLITENGSRWGAATKIVREGRILAGASGSTALCQRFLAWVSGGRSGECPAMKDGDEKATGVVFPGGRIVVEYDTNARPIRLSAPFYASGSGREFAVGAMATGADAESAVRIAAKYDLFTNGRIHVLRR